MKTTLYFASKDAVYCYSLETHLERAAENGLTEIELFEAVPDKVEGKFYCKAFQTVGETGDCGKLCEEYKPKNGKRGVCKYKKGFYTCGEEKKNFQI